MAVATAPVLDEQTRNFYRDGLNRLDDAKIPYLVGGAYAFAQFTGIERHTKDFDIFIRREDFDRIVSVLDKAGYSTELSFPHWLGKAFKGEDFIDLIFSAGNGVAQVDDTWFENAVPAEVIGKQVKLIPPEEMIWSKGLIMERERYDGADVAHVIKAIGHKLNWRRLLDRYGPYWRVLFAHIVLFGFVYPGHRSQVPQWVMDELGGRLALETKQNDTPEKVCYGSIISRQQYLTDLTQWGYKDARLKPLGNMTKEDIARWTAGIERDGDG